MNAKPHDAPRYIVRTVDEDWIDLFDSPARIDDKREAWEEARRRVRAHPTCTTVVLNRHTGATLWQSEPDIPPQYELVSLTTGTVLSAHIRRDDALTAFYDARREPREDIIAVRDTAPGKTVIVSSDD